MALVPDPLNGINLDVLMSVENDASPVFVSHGLATWLKTHSFLGDQRFMELAARHAHLLPLANWHWNLQTVLWALRQVQGLEGDFVELGVFRGHTTLFCAEYLGFAGWSKRWWLYDTFAGVPEDQLDPGWAKNNALAYNPSTFTFEEVRDRFAHIPNIEVIKGRAPEILDERAPAAISFIHMDLNNATAEIAALDKLFDRLTPGGIIVFDDYVWVTAQAQYRAEKAWFGERGLVVMELPTGQGVFVKGPSQAA
ncbi:MAG TPA: TylF/MycF/NovP-related O-methyltransferase [Caulobacteraceae bacterium]|nr:TylF/MycF/NovP-related O-methyltransferase [Caulobacteraceae bacterium]